MNENLVKGKDGRYEVRIPWVSGSESNEAQSRSLRSVERKTDRNPEWKRKYQDIVETQLKEGIVEKVSKQDTDGEKVIYLPHKPLVRQEAAATKVHMVFDASARPSPMHNSLNECVYTGPALQPQLWDIMVRARMSTHFLIGDLQKAFLQMGIAQKDKDAFRFLFNISNKRSTYAFQEFHFEQKQVHSF